MRLLSLHIDTVRSLAQLRIPFDDLTPGGLWGSPYHLIGVTAEQHAVLSAWNLSIDDVTPTLLSGKPRFAAQSEASIPVVQWTSTASQPAAEPAREALYSTAVVEPIVPAQAEPQFVAPELVAPEMVEVRSEAPAFCAVELAAPAPVDEPAAEARQPALADPASYGDVDLPDVSEPVLEMAADHASDQPAEQRTEEVPPAWPLAAPDVHHDAEVAVPVSAEPKSANDAAIREREIVGRAAADAEAGRVTTIPLTNVEQNWSEMSSFAPRPSGAVRRDPTKLRVSVGGKYREASVAKGKILLDGQSFDSPGHATSSVAPAKGDWVFWEYFDDGAGKWRMLDRDWQPAGV